MRKEYKLVQEHSFYLDENVHVWSPRDPSTHFLEEIKRDNGWKNIKQKKILDLGCGSGILGIALLTVGAKHLTFTDNNEFALELTRQNLSLNNFPSRKFKLLLSDRFSNIQDKYDVIVCNPPVQPEFVSKHPRIQAYRTNENGNGRIVLDSVITDSSNFLQKHGIVYLCCTSRHGHNKTLDLLSQKYKGQYTLLSEKEYTLDLEYLSFYMDYWIKSQLQDNDVRVYNKDANGQKFFISQNLKYLVGDNLTIDGKIKISQDDIKYSKEYFFRHYVIKIAT